MFFVRYARSELARRRGRTIVTVSGLALGVALVVVIASLTRGLDEAQQTALDPLSSIGTDLTVTLAPSQDQGGGFGPGGGGGGREVVQANSSVITDLSKLGKPGEQFEHTFFLPGTQLTFPQAQATQVAKVDGVAAAASGLILTAVHQSGTVPKIVAQIRTGGQQVQVDRQIPRPTQAELQKMQTCLQAKGIQFGPAGGVAPGGANGQGGQGDQGGGLGGSNRRAGPGGVDRGAFASCLPARLRRFRATITTPEQTLRQVVDPPQTDITSTTYTIGGVDLTRTDIGIVTPALVTEGTFLEKPGQALVTQTYAGREGLKVGSKIDLNGTSFTVVGLVRAPLGGQTADVYVPLAQLQKLSSQKGEVNVVLVRASSGSDVAGVQQNIETQYPSAQVASASDVADRISGSLVDASNLSHRLGVALAVLAALTAFLIALLLTLSSVGKRVREIGTLKALGWKQAVVVRQIVGEALAQGVAGGVIGVVVGVAVAAIIGAVGPTLTASSSTGGGAGASDFFGLGAVTARTVSNQVALTAPVAITVLLLGLLVAILGGLVAGAAGGWRAARMRPADALRQVE
jgi:ABC-type antimicrobial peptide transport system permease subunit